MVHSNAFSHLRLGHNVASSEHVSQDNYVRRPPSRFPYMNMLNIS